MGTASRTTHLPLQAHKSSPKSALSARRFVGLWINLAGCLLITEEWHR